MLNYILQCIASFNRMRIAGAIKRLDIKEGDVVFFDSSMVDGSVLSELLVARYAATPSAPSVWFMPVKMRPGQTIDDAIVTCSAANWQALKDGALDSDV